MNLVNVVNQWTMPDGIFQLQEENVVGNGLIKSVSLQPDVGKRWRIFAVACRNGNDTNQPVLKIVMYDGTDYCDLGMTLTSSLATNQYESLGFDLEGKVIIATRNCYPVVYITSPYIANTKNRDIQWVYVEEEDP